MDGVLIHAARGRERSAGHHAQFRDKLCEDLKIPVREQMIPREMLYIADEVFFTGTAAEISPLRSIDRIKVGKGSRGPITKTLQEEFFSILGGREARPAQLADAGQRAARRRHALRNNNPFQRFPNSRRRGRPRRA